LAASVKSNTIKFGPTRLVSVLEASNGHRWHKISTDGFLTFTIKIYLKKRSTADGKKIKKHGN